MTRPRAATIFPRPRRASVAVVVSELYASIQGESSHAGRPCAFIRLTGCPLRCAWCDTAFAYQGGRAMGIGEAIEAVGEFGLPLVEVTGGEPLAQEGCLDLLAGLCDAGYETLLETSGAIDVGPVDPRVIKILDIKCPASAMSDRNLWENLDRLGPRDEIKFVLADRADYEWARRVIGRHRVLRDGRPVHLSPVHGVLDPGRLGEWIVQDRLGARLHVQLHRVAWPQRDRLV